MKKWVGHGQRPHTGEHIGERNGHGDVWLFREQGEYPYCLCCDCGRKTRLCLTDEEALDLLDRDEFYLINHPLDNISWLVRSCWPTRSTRRS